MGNISPPPEKSCDRREKRALPPRPLLLEKHLWREWLRNADRKNLRLASGETLEVVNPGSWNTEAGPDFLNAALLVDGQPRSGDIEVHRSGSDWFAHGHHLNPAYAKVALHVVANATGGPELPTLELADVCPGADDDLQEDGLRQPRGHCAAAFARYSDEELSSFFRSAGMRRFQEKSDAIAKGALRHGIRRALLEKLFDACGYKRNRAAFAELFQRFIQYPPRLEPEELEAVIWGESGFLPDSGAPGLCSEMAAFAKERWRTWWRLRLCQREPIPWRLDGVRPLNGPCRRVAALLALLGGDADGLFDRLSEAFASLEPERSFWKNFKTLLVRRDPLWDRFTDFDAELKTPASVLGESRALDIAVNVALPALNARARLDLDDALAKKSALAWASLPVTQRNIAEGIAAERWLIPAARARRIFDDTPSCQGCLHVYKRICEPCRVDCGFCALPDVFQA